ncbi:MAG: PDZ domain-containing protein [Chitinispirillaceae bacterium]|nr:PDZ domain-containing protein [Chitinispirillaceae bacterium]
MNIRRVPKFPVIAAIMIVSGCNVTPFEHDGNDPVYRFAAANLDTFFIYRNRLPRLYAFETPEALYGAVNDPYTDFYNKEKTDSILLQQSTKRSGIGIVVDSAVNGYLIREVIVGGPAELYGLKPLDTIVRVDEIPVAGMPYEDFLNLLRGEVRSEVVLFVKRGADIVDVAVIREEFLLPSVAVDSIGASVAMIVLKGFYPQSSAPGGTMQEFDEALEKTAWADHMILDLRSNTGGYIAQCIGIVSELVEENTPIISVRYRDVDPATGMPREFEQTYKAFNPGSAASAAGRRLYILVDSSTASASEILVSCLMQQEGVTVIGDTTFGKACGQILLGDEPDGVMARITFMTILPVGENAVSYNKVGIVPDILAGTADAFDVALHLIEETMPAKHRIGTTAGGYRPGRCDVSVYSAIPSALFSRGDRQWLNCAQ